MDIQPQLVTLDSLFEKRLFRIPQYQRAYSWQSKQRKDLFDDIRKSMLGGENRQHFMSTIVGLRREKNTILITDYQAIEIVDGQQRITTLILILKSIAKALNDKDSEEKKMSEELHNILVKEDKASLLLLQTNHDFSDYFANYIRHGKHPSPDKAETLADRELLKAMDECEKFVREQKEKGQSLADLVRHITNRLTFVLYEIGDEKLVYTVFEVLNSRGLDVSWFDRLKSMLMAVIFETKTDSKSELIDEVHKLWASIYRIVGFRIGLSSESLRFAATLRAKARPARPINEEGAVGQLLDQSKDSPEQVIETTQWIKSVTEAVDQLHKDLRRNSITKIAHARLVAVAINLHPDLKDDEKKQILRRWENVTFRIFGMCRKDARTGVGDYVRLSWSIIQNKLTADDIMSRLSEIGKSYPIEAAISDYVKEQDCYYWWGDELRYFLCRYEEFLAEEARQNFNNEQWNRIWEKRNAEDSIEHITPQSTGEDHVHWLGNLLMLPPRLNSTLGKKTPEEKAEAYNRTGLLIAGQVADRIKKSGGWGIEEVRAREAELLEWASREWAD